MKVNGVNYVRELKSGQYDENFPKAEVEIKLALKNIEKGKEIDKEIELLKKEKEKLFVKCDALTIGTCPKNICFDEAGYIYNNRTCIRCGRGSLL